MLRTSMCDILCDNILFVQYDFVRSGSYVVRDFMYSSSCVLPREKKVKSSLRGLSQKRVKSLREQNL